MTLRLRVVERLAECHKTGVRSRAASKSRSLPLQNPGSQPLWLMNLSRHQHHLESLKTKWLNPPQGFWFSSWEFAFLIHSQVMLLMVFHRSYVGNYYIKQFYSIMYAWIKTWMKLCYDTLWNTMLNHSSKASLDTSIRHPLQSQETKGLRCSPCTSDLMWPRLDPWPQYPSSLNGKTKIYWIAS